MTMRDPRSSGILALLGATFGLAGCPGRGVPADDEAQMDVPTDAADYLEDDTWTDTELDVGLDVADVPDDPGEDQAADVEPDVAEPTMNFYFGNLHSHTAFSDGVGPPSECFLWARDVVGFDFYAVTDHAEMIDEREWNNTGAAADAITEDGVFVGLRGFEWSHPVAGHSNVFDTPGYTSAWSTVLLGSFYDWVDDNNGLAQFNHPGREWLTFNWLAYEDDVGDNFFAIEVANKGDSIAEGEFLPFYHQALDNGWYVAPTANQDNHSQEANSHRTVIVAPALTRDALLEAMRARRLYASDDPNLRLTFRVGDAWMGSRIPVGGGSATFSIRVQDDEPGEQLELITNGGEVVVSSTPPPETMDVTWEREVQVARGRWYYVKVTVADILDGRPPVQMAVSAPIWFE